MKIFFIVIILLTASAVWALSSKTTTKPGTVIILNGPSGSGKSSIQKAFQYAMMPNLWVKVGIDTLFDAPMPNITMENLSFWQSVNPIRWVEESQDETGNKIISLFVGEQGNAVAYAMNSAIVEYAKNGCNVIVDYIAYDPAWLADLQKKLSGIKTYYIAVDISLETLEQREAARGTSPKGHARSHYFIVYGDINYDLRVNSEKNSAEEIAQQIKEFIGI
jgi:chloramphenicol 3-O phosphotransferase